MPDARRGLLFGVAAYAMWGLFPLYWPLLEPAGAFEILAHRVLWSCLTMFVLLLLLRRGPQLLAIWRDRRVRLLLTVAAVVISVNWATYIWGVNNDRVVETSLGYFINPLVTVLMGVLILHERLRPLQWVADGDRDHGGRRAHPRLRAAAVRRAGPGVHVRQLRAVQEDRQRRRDRQPDLRDGRDRAVRARRTSAGSARPAARTSPTTDSATRCSS